MFWIRKNICYHRKKNLLFLPCNMAAVQNLYYLVISHRSCKKTRARREETLFWLINKDIFPPDSESVIKVREKLLERIFSKYGGLQTLHALEFFTEIKNGSSLVCFCLFFNSDIRRGEGLKTVEFWNRKIGRSFGNRKSGFLVNPARSSKKHISAWRRKQPCMLLFASVTEVSCTFLHSK